jgi:hypothetical protein
MKRYFIIFASIALFVGGCDSGSKNTKPTTPTTTGCSPEGATQCNANALQTCVDTVWQSHDCGTEKICGAVAGLSGVFTCNATVSTPVNPPAGDIPKKAFEKCTAGDKCETGLVCRAEIGLCVKNCDPATPGVCASSEVCTPVTQTNTRDGVCFGQSAQRDTACIDNGNLCAPGQGQCSQVSETETACKLTCNSNQIGQRSTCPENEICQAASGLVQPQTPAKACTADTDCNAGFTCYTFSDDTQSCGRPVGWCGATAPVLGNFSQAGVTEFVQQPGNLCNMTTGHIGCGIVGATGTPAQVECASLGEDASGQDVSVCIGSCEGTTTDLDCGTGFKCARPAQADSFFFDVQTTGDTRVTCTAGDNSACDAVNSYTCFGPFTANAYYCSRPAKVCMNAH